MNFNPDNPTPILACEGLRPCGFVSHRFIRSDKAANGFLGAYRQIFACNKCHHERCWGVVDPIQAVAKRAVSE